jgi:pSer/pThr/pTyr-binding forkhead associated (FHA) protein
VIKLILEERGELQPLELDRDTVTIGRTADNAVRVADALSSRTHCKIEKTKDGFFVEDMKSRNGTTLNGDRLVERKLLAVGDRIAIGQSVIHFQARLDKAATGPATAPTTAPTTAPAPGKSAAVPAAPKAKTSVARKARFVLKGLEGTSKDKSYGITAFPFTIGTKKNISLALEPDEEISPEHCMLVEDEGTVHVVDLNSEHGTHVDGKRVKGRERLKPNATLAVGKAKFRFKDLGGKGAEAASDEDLDAVVDPRAADPKRPASAKAPKPAPVAVAEEADLSKMGDDEPEDAKTPAQGQPRPAPKKDSSRTDAPSRERAGGGDGVPPREKTARRPKQAVAVSPEAATLVAGEETGIAATGDFAAAIAETGEGGAGGPIAVILVVLALVGSGVPVALSLLAHEDADPQSEKNFVTNWSFEAEPGLQGWKVESGKLVADGFGKRAVRLEAQASRGELRSAETRRLEPGKDVALRAAVKTAGQAAAVLAIEWTDERRPDWKAVSYAAVAEQHPEWGDAGAQLTPPSDATHACVVAWAVPTNGGTGSASFDRISLTFEAPQPAAASLKGAGLEISATPRGVLTVSRPGDGTQPARALAQVQLALAAADGSRGDPLESQKAWAIGTSAGDPGDGGLFADGTILDLASGERIAAAVVVKPAAETLRITWELARKDLAEKRPVRIVIEAPHAKDISPIEIAVSSGVTKTLDEVFAKAGAYVRLDHVVEMAWGTSAEQSSLRTHGEVALEAERIGDGIRLELITVPTVKGDVRVCGFDLARASSLARERVRLLLEQAEAARKDGRLEEAREVYSRIAREFSHEPRVANRARAEAASLAQMADRILDSVTGAAEDAEELGLPALARAAHVYADALAKAFPGASQLDRAKQAVARAEDNVKKVDARTKGQKARELVDRAWKHREANRLRLARQILAYVIANYPADDPAVKEARERMAALPPEAE